jgi:hypothetical protein
MRRGAGPPIATTTAPIPIEGIIAALLRGRADGSNPESVGSTGRALSSRNFALAKYPGPRGYNAGAEFATLGTGSRVMPKACFQHVLGRHDNHTLQRHSRAAYMRSVCAGPGGNPCTSALALAGGPGTVLSYSISHSPHPLLPGDLGSRLVPLARDAHKRRGNDAFNRSCVWRTYWPDQRQRLTTPKVLPGRRSL